MPSDFEVYRTEYSTRSSTVLMIDMSRSMFYNGCFTAAKRIALALDSLIRGKYPRDTSSIIGFSYMPQELKPADLPTLDWNEYKYGTNMQHGFQLARQMLGRQKGANRQIIIITDGEPTAHIENGAGPLQLAADAAHVSGNAARGDPLHARRHHDQHLHARALAVHDRSSSTI